MIEFISNGEVVWLKYGCNYGLVILLMHNTFEFNIMDEGMSENPICFNPKTKILIPKQKF